MPDELEVRVEPTPAGPWRDLTVLLVNGLDLRLLVAQVGLGDGWIGIPTDVVIEHPDRLLGGPARWEDPRGPWYEDPALLACGCGQPACDAILARVTVGADSVRWELRRARDDTSLPIGPFEFARAQYESALDPIR